MKKTLTDSQKKLSNIETAMKEPDSAAAIESIQKEANAALK